MPDQCVHVLALTAGHLPWERALHPIHFLATHFWGKKKTQQLTVAAKALIKQMFSTLTIPSAPPRVPNAGPPVPGQVCSLGQEHPLTIQDLMGLIKPGSSEQLKTFVRAWQSPRALPKPSKGCQKKNYMVVWVKV